LDPSIAGRWTFYEAGKIDERGYVIMAVDRKVIKGIYSRMSPKAKSRLNQAVDLIVKAKESGGKVVAVVGSGPNIHEGVTTLIAEMIHKGIVDGV